MTEREQLLKKLSDKQWRIFSWKLYFIKNKNWEKVSFIPNEAQAHYYENRHTKNIILKARQLWFSTLIDIDMLDDVLFSSYYTGGIIADNKDSSIMIFKDKIKFVYDNVPEWLKSNYKLKTDRKWELMFENNTCSVSVDTSFRWWTLQHIHISEYGKICNKYPEKAREIQTGALNTIAPNSRADIESTAEWNSWNFFDMTMRAMELEEQEKELTNMDYKFHFYAWWLDKTYTLDSEDIIRNDIHVYFQKILDDSWINRKYPNLSFTDWQKRWYQKKLEEQKDDMQREYPSYPKEAFDLAIKGAYYEKELSLARTQWRVWKVFYDPKLAVYTSWDLWGAWWWDETAIWFYQKYAKEIRIIDYWEWSGYWLTEIAQTIVNPRYNNYDTHNFPFDVEVTEYTTWKTRLSIAKKELNGKINVVKKGLISDWINAVREIFINCYFDETKCYTGLSRLAWYRREFDEKNWMFRNKPKHDINSNGADSFRYLAVDYKSLIIRKPQKRTFTNKMTWENQRITI